MKTTKAFFEIERQDGPRTFDGQFSHLKVHILVPQYRWDKIDEDAPNGMYLNRVLTIQWQGHYDRAPSDWYARRLEVVQSEHVADLKLATSFAERIEKLIVNEDKGAIPLTVVGACVMLRLKRVVYDPRTSHHHLAEHIKPADYSQWMMEYRKMEGDHQYNPAGLVMARDEEEARRLLAEDTMKRSEYSGVEHRLAVLTQWANAGKPVVQTGLWSLTNRKVETRSVELLLRSPEEEAKAAAEAAAKEVEVAA